MGKIILYLLTALAVGYISEIKAQTNQQMETSMLTEEQKNVLGTVEKMVTAFHNKDIDGILACYETDATIVFEPEKPISGSNLLKAAFLEAFTISPVYKFKGHEVFITGNIATHITPWTMKAQLPDGTSFEQSGLSVAVLRKQKNGSWLMIFDNPHGQLLMEK